MSQTPEQVMQSALDAFGTLRQVDKCLGEMHELGQRDGSVNPHFGMTSDIKAVIHKGKV